MTTPMTPTPEGRQLAADLANAVRRERGEHTIWNGGNFEARYGTAHEAFARLATEHLALKAKHEEALADLREIDRVVHEHGPESPAVRMVSIRTIAAKWRVETDPLLIEAREMFIANHKPFDGDHAEIRAGGWDDRPVLASILAALKRGYEIGRKS